MTGPWKLNKITISMNGTDMLIKNETCPKKKQSRRICFCVHLAIYWKLDVGICNGSKKKKKNTHNDLSSESSPMSPLSCPFRPMVDNPLRIIENNKIDRGPKTETKKGQGR
jgi:hypothetical protein